MEAMISLLQANGNDKCAKLNWFVLRLLSFMLTSFGVIQPFNFTMREITCRSRLPAVAPSIMLEL